MKAKFFFYVLLLCNFSYGQTQVLLENVWYLEKFVINGSDITYTENTNHNHIISFESLDTEIILKAGYCQTMFGLIGNVTNDVFSYDSFYQFIVDCNFNSDDFNMLNTITSFYFNTSGNFNLTISDVMNYKKLELVNSFNNRVIYNNVNLGFSTFFDKSELIIYPNPINDILYFKSDFEISMIKVFGFDGKLIESSLSYSGNQIDFSNMKSGIFFLEFEHNGKITRRKVIKK